MANKYFTNESLEFFVNKIKGYTDAEVSAIPTHNELTNEQIDNILGPLDGSVGDDSSSGGSTSSSNIGLDITLTKSGMAADAKVVGDKLAEKASNSHSHIIATANSNGFMSYTDKIKLDGIENIVVDSELSFTSINPVQNKIISEELSKAVKSINNIMPDENGNVVISTSSGNGGVSPTITVSNIENGYKLTIADINGVSYIDVMNGLDAHSPVKGTDYWTDEDKSEIVQDVLSLFPNGDEVSY